MNIVKNSLSGDFTSGELLITRTFDAPRALVFKAWTDPRQVAQWWGPAGFTNPVCEVDARTGGAMRIHMRAPDGTVYPMTAVFREVVEPERIVFVSGAHVDESGKPLFEVLTTVTFAEQGGRTTLTMSARPLNPPPEAAPYLSGMEQGWGQSIDRLAAFVLKT
jgi:uncharacterized protein YndB with AHSA1/START domain